MVAQDDCERHDAVREMITVPDGQPLLYGERNQGALVQLVLNLRHRYPGLRIAGGYSPPFRPETEEERDAIAAEINASGAQVRPLLRARRRRRRGLPAALVPRRRAAPCAPG
jgi:UDP-N-acetyl-D-mannosaminuronic acid transferase (WecB/TagA/CpsF family)